ncbi:MAG: hypothetical protein Q4D80_00710 [Pseudomonadota bacterium]|nr:hypothetical protein [Pseudomonadota bacterium]
MSEKYFIAGFAVLFMVFIIAFCCGIFFYWRLQHLKKLTQISVLRRQQLMTENRFFSTAVLNQAVNLLFFSFSTAARNALVLLAGGRPQKAASFLKHKNMVLSCLLAAHCQPLEPIYQKLVRRSKKDKSPQLLLAAVQISRLLYHEENLPFLYKRLFAAKHLSAEEKACKAYLSAFAYMREGDMLSASEQASAALKTFKHLHYLFEEAQTYLLTAEIYRLSCVNDIAQTMIESALRIFTECRLSFFQAQTTAVWGQLLLYENRLAEAEDKLNKALSFAQNRLKADIFNQFSLLKLAQKLPEEALKYAQKALNLHKKNSSRHGMAFSLQLCGHFAFETEKFKKAADLARKAAALYLEQHNFSAYIESLYLQARALAQIRQYDKAEKLLRLCLDENKKSETNFHIADVYSLLGLIFLQKNDLARAKALLHQSLRLEQNHERCSGLAIDYANLALIENLSGNPASADNNFRLAVEYAKKTGDEHLLHIIQHKKNS